MKLSRMALRLQQNLQSDESVLTEKEQIRIKKKPIKSNFLDILSPLIVKRDTLKNWVAEMEGQVRHKDGGQALPCQSSREPDFFSW